MRSSSMAVVATAVVLGIGGSAGADPGFRQIDFPTSDGIQVRADVYEGETASSTWVVLFHQAGWSRGEYREIAPALAEAGYRVIAVDQRSGRGVKGVPNETARRAREKKLRASYLDAYPDLEAALAHVRGKLGATQVIAWGSSYSASLVLRLAAEHPAEVTAAVSFSPGEYFGKAKGPHYVEAFAKRVRQPLFVTSSKRERGQVKPIFDASPSDEKILFTPASKGQHGSRALWSKWPDHDVYWAAVKGFLETYAPPSSAQ